MKIYIKNMVCSRCIMVIESVLTKLGLHPISVELGSAEVIEADIGFAKINLIDTLQSLGFELIEDKREQTVEKIKNEIIDLVHYKNNSSSVNLSEYLSQKLAQDYGALTHLFSEAEGTTIEQYYISQKIERVKELLTYDELSLSEIAYKLHYSSVGHLSNQFKKSTGFTPTIYKQMKHKNRKLIEDI